MLPEMISTQLNYSVKDLSIRVFRDTTLARLHISNLKS